MNKSIQHLLLLISCSIFASCSSENEALESVTAKNGERPKEKSQRLKEHSTPQRLALFGDLHVHSSWSLDSYVNFNPAGPEEAYRFARGEEVIIAGERRVQLDTALDFAAVTDHAEYFGELSLCLDKDANQYQLPLCQEIRNEDRQRDIVTRVYKNLIIRDVVSQNPQRESEICGDDDSLCHERAASVWQKLISIADTYNSPGEFTTLVAYEWTGNPAFKNLHRNVIFKSNEVPALPASYFEANTPAKLWQQLSNDCQAPCEAIAIPHNSNQSKGLQFPESVSLEDAQLRSKIETLVEVVQTKGESECKTGVGNVDEFCDFEKLEQLPVCSDNEDVLNPECARLCEDENDEKCLHKNNYLRNALKDGLRIANAIGVNPYQFGMIGSTDTHNGTPGASQENNYLGAFGEEDGTPEGRARIPAIKSFKPPRLHSSAGLAGVWAEENTRESIFAALKRRETFATSGPRISLRFFGAWDLGDKSSSNLIKRAYQNGVSMGGELPPRQQEIAPEFLLWAMKAADGVPLQRIQIIKGWLEGGQTKEETYDAVCSDDLQVDPNTHRCPDNGAIVDLSTCGISSDKGASELSVRWRDPAFDATQSAFYYIRVLENPSCRWSSWEALREGKPVFHDVSPVIQERAWSSPIWFTPED
jgi:hypothetical protein